jgi:hypothetical protein
MKTCVTESIMYEEVGIGNSGEGDGHVAAGDEGRAGAPVPARVEARASRPSSWYCTSLSVLTFTIPLPQLAHGFGDSRFRREQDNKKVRNMYLYITI